jgi:hypothetical protein
MGSSMKERNNGKATMDVVVLFRVVTSIGPSKKWYLSSGAGAEKCIEMAGMRNYCGRSHVTPLDTWGNNDRQ